MALAKAAATTAADVRKALDKRVVSLYRRICRDVPKVLVMYQLETTVAEARHMILLHFRKNAGATDPRVVEMLLANAAMDVEETMQQWKQKPHVQAILQPQVAAPDPWLDQEELIKRFEDGTMDERDVWAGWDEGKQKERVAKLRARLQANREDGWEQDVHVQSLLARLAAPKAAPMQ